MFLQCFPMNLYFADANVIMRRHKSALFRTLFRSLRIIVYLHTVTFSICSMFNFERDNFVLKLDITLISAES